MKKQHLTDWSDVFSSAKSNHVLPKTSAAWATGIKAEPLGNSSLREFQSTAKASSQLAPILLLEALVRLSAKSDVEPLNRHSARKHLVINTESSSVENSLNTARVEDLQQRFSSRLLDALKQEPFEAGVVGQADKIVKESIEQNALATFAWLNDLFVDNYRRPAIAADLLVLVSRIPYSVAKPAGVLMAMAGLSHKNGAVQEAAIRSFENWVSPESLAVLESIRPSEKWLTDYLEDVKRDLKALCETPS